MNRFSRPVLACGLALLLVGLLAALITLPAAATVSPAGPKPAATQNIIRVPDDHATIQEAIDAAQEGDEIRIVGDLYKEALWISKSITLSGGWNQAFTGTSPVYTAVDAQNLDRAITISGTHPGMVVAISGFAVINGDATGKGGVEIAELQTGTAAAPDVAAVSDSRTPADFALRLREQVSDMAARGRLPGGQSALPAILARLDRLTEAAGADDTRVAPAVAGAISGTADCGGGIYVRGAGLHLEDSVIGVLLYPNVASRNGLGAGGGLCAIDIPAAGLWIEQVQMDHDTASATGAGLGGAVFISSTAPGAVRFTDFTIYNNVAGRGGDGYGGGVYIFDAPDATFTGGVVQYNLASGTGRSGYGGGLAIVASPGVQLSDLEILANSANTAWAPVDLAVPMGYGGGVYVRDSDDVNIGEGSLFRENQAALHGEGLGGGLFVGYGRGLRIHGAEFAGNWSIVYPYQFEGGESLGGGLYLDMVHDARITHTTLRNNIVALVNGYCQWVFGGALAAVGGEDIRLEDSQIRANSGGACDRAVGRPVAHGAVSLISGSQFVTITGNTFTENVAELGDNIIGLGGALYLEGASHALVRQNSFLRNISGVGGGVGGALVMEGSADVLLDRNQFIGNRASASEGAQFDLGGAIAVNTTRDLRIVNNLLVSNTAAKGAGMLLVGDDTGAAADTTVVNNTFYDNLVGSAINLRLWTVPITLTNNVIVSHTMGVEVESGAATVRYTLYNANDVNSGGGGVIDEAHVVTGPVNFVDPAAGDFRLRVDSAARDAGDPAGVPPAPDHDAGGVARPQGPAVDLGAYEWQGHWRYLPLVAKDWKPAIGWAVGSVVDGYGAIIHTTDDGQTGCPLCGNRRSGTSPW